MEGQAAEALILASRGDEAKNNLDEALTLARNLKTDSVVARIIGFQGDAAFYRGDFKSAQASYAEALQVATRSKEPTAILFAKANMGKIAVQEKRTAEAMATLRQVVDKANELGLKYTSVECSILMGEAIMQGRDRSHARQELEHALVLSDKLGMQPLSARAHYLLATIDHDSGNASDAQDHYREALRLLDAMKKDPGAEKLMQRPDFKAIYEEASKATQPAKS